MLWDSTFLSLLVRFTPLTLGSRSLDSTRRFLELTPLVVSPEFGPQVPDRGSPFSFRACLAFSGTNSVAQFSCGVIDIVESMSRRVFLTAVRIPQSAFFFLNFYDVTLFDFCGLSVWICMSCVTTALCSHYSFLVIAFSCPIWVSRQMSSLY